MESILCEAIKLEFEAYTSVSSCSGSSRELNEVCINVSVTNGDKNLKFVH